jgi:hypothetical protein
MCAWLEEVQHGHHRSGEVYEPSRDSDERGQSTYVVARCATTDDYRCHFYLFFVHPPSKLSIFCPILNVVKGTRRGRHYVTLPAKGNSAAVLILIQRISVKKEHVLQLLQQ